jgi:glycosyltransferase involved in cell wall biosynthesis
VTPLRTVIAAPWGERAGGAEEMLWTILRHLDRTRIEPQLVFLSTGPFADEVASLGIQTWTISAGRLRQPLRYTRTVWALARLIQANSPDIVLAWSAKAHLYLGAATLLARNRSAALWWQHAIPGQHWIDRLATLLPAAAVGCSSRASESAQLRLLPRRHTFVVHPGVDIEVPRHSASRADLGIPNEAWVIGSVGRLQPWKGHNRVIAAVAELRAFGVPAVGVIIGGESFGFSHGYEEQLRELASQLGVGQNVIFMGHVPNPNEYYALMDVVVNASAGEPFGIALVEAMAAGRPVIAFRQGGPAEIIEDGVSGLLAEETELSATLLRLAADNSLSRALGRAGTDRARSLFSAGQAATDFAAAVIAVAEERRTQ